MKKILFFSLSLLFIAGAYVLYSFLQKDPFEARFPIVFNASQLPQTEVKIEGNSYLLKIDLGASEPFSLTGDILAKIQKEDAGSIHSFDLKGNEYCSKTYIVPEIRIRNLKATRFEVREESPDFLAQGSVIYSPEKDIHSIENQGSLGRPLFQDINLFLDFHNAVMFACRHLRDRKKEGYRLNQLVSLPIEQNPENEIILKVMTDVGIQRFLIDTGCTRSLIKPSSVIDQSLQTWQEHLKTWYSSKFILGNRDFGGFHLLVFPMDSKFSNFDGIIGMDFLKNHVLYFDFKNKTAHIGKAEECSPDS